MTRPRRCVFLGLAVAALTMSAMALPAWPSPCPIACSIRARTLTDANGSRTRTFSDLRDLITSVHELGGPRAAVTEYTYDPLEQILAVTDDQGNPTRVAYDLLGRRTVIDNPDTGKTEFFYDLAGNLTRKVTANLRAKGAAIHYGYRYTRLETIHYPHHRENDVRYEYGPPLRGRQDPYGLTIGF